MAATSPFLIRTRRMYFSPRKFLISTIDPLSWMTTLIGKWAYTERILYRKPYSQTEVKAMSWAGKENELFSQQWPACAYMTRQLKSWLQNALIPALKDGHRAYYSGVIIVCNEFKVFSPEWLPWSCSGHGCRWCGLWPAPSCCPTIYLHEADEENTVY